MGPERRALPILTAVLIATSAQAAPSGQAGAPGVILRGPQRAPPASTPPANLGQPSSGGADEDQPAPLQEGEVQTRVGGAQCRLSCAENLYICRADRDESECSVVWGRCVAACPEDSSSPL